MRAIVVLVSLSSLACSQSPRTTTAADVPAVRIRCDADHARLVCQALLDWLGRPSTVAPDAVWTTSNSSVASVDDGRIVSVGNGSADIQVSVRSRPDIRPSLITVFSRVGQVPEVGHTLEGELRDATNAAVPGATVTLLTDDTLVQSAQLTRGADGSFRFAPLAPGHYQMRADKAGFRSARLEVDVPSDRPVTLVLLPEPRDTDDHTRTRVAAR